MGFYRDSNSFATAKTYLTTINDVLYPRGMVARAALGPIGVGLVLAFLFAASLVLAEAGFSGWDFRNNLWGPAHLVWLGQSLVPSGDRRLRTTWFIAVTASLECLALT